MRTLLLLLAILVGSVPVRAADDIGAARAVISAQAEAFGRDDAATAYSYAAPAIQGIFAEADGFIAMVRKSYAPIWRHRSFEFGEGRAVDGKIVQVVHIVDADGAPWEALYTLEQQSDGSFRITGCTLLRASGQAI